MLSTLKNSDTKKYLIESGNTKKFPDPIRAEMYMDTIAYIRKMQYPCNQISSYLIMGEGRSIFPSHRKYPRNKGNPANIFVFKESVMEMVGEFQGVFEVSPLVLAFGSSINPYGGVMNGGYGQLEDLHLCSNLSLMVERNLHKHKEMEHLCNHGIFFPELSLIRDENFEMMKEPYSFSCFMASAIRYPKKKIINGKQYFLLKKDENYTRTYLDMFFRLALLRGNRAIIIGAPGCGSYDGPVHHIAEILKELVEIYQHYFDYIGFPIIVKNERDERNFDVFKETFAPLEYRYSF